MAANVDKALLPTHLLPCNLVPNRPDTDTGLWPGGGEPCPRGLYPPSALSCTPSVLYHLPQCKNEILKLIIVHSAFASNGTSSW